MSARQFNKQVGCMSITTSQTKIRVEMGKTRKPESILDVPNGGRTGIVAMSR
jgi:hypothetical protein